MQIIAPPSTGVVSTPVSFDAVGAGSSTGVASGDPTPATMSWSHTATGSNRAVVVAIFVGTDITSIDYTAHTRSVTYGGVSMTSLGAKFTNNDFNGQDNFGGFWVELWGLLNPATGAQTVSVSYARTSTTYGLSGNSISYTNVGSFGSVTTGSGTEAGTSMSLNVSAATSERVVGAFYQWLNTAGSNITAYNQTSRHSVGSNSWMGAGVIGDAAGAASVTFSATRPTSGNDYASIALRLTPV